MRQKIIITILFLCSFVSLCFAEPEKVPVTAQVPAAQEVPNIPNTPNASAVKKESLETVLLRFAQNLNGETRTFLENQTNTLKKELNDLTTKIQSLESSHSKSQEIKTLKEQNQKLWEETKAEGQTLKTTIRNATIVNVLIFVLIIGTNWAVYWFALRRSEVFPSSVPVLPDSVPAPEKEKSQSGELTRILSAIDDLKKSLRQQDSSALADSKIKINDLENKLQTALQSADSLREEKAEAQQKQFSLRNEIAGVRSELDSARLELTSVSDALRQEKAESAKLQTRLEEELARKRNEGLNEKLRNDPTIQEDLKDLPQRPEIQERGQQVVTLLGILDKSSEKLYPYILYELSVVLADVIRQSGWSESCVQSRLEAWAKVLNSNPFGFNIQVPRLNERLTPQMVVSGRNSDGIVHKVKSWCVTRQGNCVLSAEVE